MPFNPRRAFIIQTVGIATVVLSMAAVVVLLRWEQMRGFGQKVGVILMIMAAGSLLYFSHWVRKLIRWEAIIERLPLSEVIKKVDAAVFGLRKKKGALLGALALNSSLQVVGVAAVYLAGQAIGIERAEFSHYLVFVPIAYLANALPISFGGIGLMEGAFMKLFTDAGVGTASQGFMVGLLTRFMALVWSLPGAVFALQGAGRAEPPELSAPTEVTQAKRPEPAEG
jgi:hypothetical protein